MDFQSHKQICSYYTTGTWTPFGKRPEDDYWVNNAAMAKARRELRARRAREGHRVGQMTPDEELEEQERVEKLVEAARAKEKAEQAAQAEIEKRAYWGLDGPRPCMYQGGKRV